MNDEMQMTNPLDLLDPKDFKSTGDYLAAAAELHMRRQSPEFRDAYGRMLAEFSDRQMQAARESAHAEYEQILRKTRLNEAEEKKVNEKAAQLIQADISAGRVARDQVVSKTNQYVEQLTKQAVADKANRTHFNKLFREAMGSHQPQE